MSIARSFAPRIRQKPSCASALGLLDSDTPARHLKMKIGRVTQHWNKNCLAVGLSQGFIEPLEATALLFIQQTAAVFVDFLEQGDLSEAAQARFNTHVNEHFEGTRDYIVTHYKTNSRTDTEYWRANAANRNLSEPLKQLLNLWMSGNSIAPAVRKQSLGRGYPVFSWYSIMSGMGIFPDAADLRPPQQRGAKLSALRKSTICSSAAPPIIGIIGKFWTIFRRAAMVRHCRSIFGEGVFGPDRRARSGATCSPRSDRRYCAVGARLACRARVLGFAGIAGALSQSSSTAARPSMRLMTAPEIGGQIVL